MFQKWEEVKIPVPWGHVSGKWWGLKDVQPLVAIHGHQDNAGTFDTLVPLLIDQNISVLCIDLPGHGLSSPLPYGLCYHQVWDGVVLLRRIVKYFKWKQISLMGHSLGGAIAFLYAATYSNQVHKYIALDVVCPPLRKVSAAHTIDKFLQNEHRQSPVLSYNNALGIFENAHKNNLTEESCKILMKRGTKLLSNQKYVFNRDERLKSGYISSFTLEQIRELALDIKCQVLNIRANPGQIIEGEDYYEPVLDCIKQNASVFEYHRIPGTHHVHLNNPERICNIIKVFLQS